MNFVVERVIVKLLEPWLRRLDRLHLKLIFWVSKTSPLKRTATVLSIIVLLLGLTHYRWVSAQIKFCYTALSIALSGSSKARLSPSVDAQAVETVDRAQRLMTSALEGLPSMDSVSYGRLSERIDSWIIGQCVVCLDASLIPNRDKIKSFWEYSLWTNSTEYHAWQSLKLESNPPHIPASAWVIRGMAKLQMPTTRSEIDFLLKEQFSNGFWPIYPTTDSQASSTYATIEALLAIHSQLSNTLLPPDTRVAMTNALHAGISALLSYRDAKRSRWKDYPFYHKANYFDSLSGQVIYALHEVGVSGIKDIDIGWLDNLPDPAPKVEDVDISLYWINAKDYGSKTYGYREDQIQHYRLPWVLVATVRASYNADLIRKTRTSLWLTKVVSESDILNADTVHELYECAELTFALKEAVR